MEKMIELLEQLAVQLGVTIEYLWATLVRQQYASGIMNLISGGICLILFVVTICLTPKIYNYCANEEKYLADDRKKNGTGYLGSRVITSEKEDLFNCLKIITIVFGIIVAAVLLIIGLCAIPLGIKQLINPEYYALEEILDTIKGSIQ